MVPIHQYSSNSQIGISSNNPHIDSMAESYSKYNTETSKVDRQQYRFFKRTLNYSKGYTKDKYMGPYKNHYKKD
jgi:hypothetical protein